MVVGEGNLNPYRSLLDCVPQVQLINKWLSEEEIAAIFNQANIVVLPYIAASQSGVVPIAASFALPVIATRVGGIPEQIEHETTGLLVEPGSVTELVAAIQRLIENPQLARQLGENLQRDYQENKNGTRLRGSFLKYAQWQHIRTLQNPELWLIPSC
jgi:glycosyltransferase involved in cell wall biosynthesis